MMTIIITICLVLSCALFIAFWVAIIDIQNDIEELEQIGAKDEEGGQE